MATGVLPASWACFRQGPELNLELRNSGKDRVTFPEFLSSKFKLLLTSPTVPTIDLPEPPDGRTVAQEKLMEENATTSTTDGSPEQVIWAGSSSQVRNLHIYILCALFCWLIIPIFYALAKWIQLRARFYEITTQRVRIRQGVFSKRTDELELYRVKDSTVLEPFWQRLFGLGNIVITTHDATTPVLTLEALPDATKTREKLRTAIEQCRDRKRVRIAELE